MKTYEAVIILDDRKVQDDGKAFIEEFSTKVTGAGGEIIKETPLGRKQFARQIKKSKTGLYWDLIFNLDEKKVIKLPDSYRLDDRVLRMRAFVYDRPEDPKASEKEKKTKKTEAVKGEPIEEIV